MPSGAADPVGQRRAVERDPLPGEDLRLAIKRKVVGVFGDQHLRDRRFGRQAASISRAGAGDCTTKSSQARQAYFGRRTTRTRNCAGTTSRRSLTSSPILCNAPRQQGQVLSSRSTRLFDARQMSRQRAAVRAALFGPPCRGQAQIGFPSSPRRRPPPAQPLRGTSSIWSSGSVSARRPKRWRCISLMIWTSRSFRARSASSIALSSLGYREARRSAAA